MRNPQILAELTAQPWFLSSKMEEVVQLSTRHCWFEVGMNVGSCAFLCQVMALPILSGGIVLSKDICSNFVNVCDNQQTPVLLKHSDVWFAISRLT